MKEAPKEIVSHPQWEMSEEEDDQQPEDDSAASDSDLIASDDDDDEDIGDNMTAGNRHHHSRHRHDDDEVDANITTKSKKSSHDSNFSSSKSREFDRLFNHAQKIDQEIRDIYSKLPKVNPEDLKFMQQFCFDNDDDIIAFDCEYDDVDLFIIRPLT